MKKNIFEQLWDYLYEVYLSAEPGYYENLDFSKSPLFSLRLMVLGLFAGTIIACIAMAYNKQTLGGVVRRIIESGATSRESAKTAAELGLEKGYLAKNALRSSSTLRRFVKCVAAEDFYDAQNAEREQLEAAATESANKEGKKPKKPKYKEHTYMVDIENDRFYIPEELRDRAEIRYARKGSGTLAMVLGIAALLIAFFVVLLIMPWILESINDIAGVFKG